MNEKQRPEVCFNCKHPTFWHGADGCGFTGPGRYACPCAASRRAPSGANPKREHRYLGPKETG